MRLHCYFATIENRLYLRLNQLRNRPNFLPESHAKKAYTNNNLIHVCPKNSSARAQRQRTDNSSDEFNRTSPAEEAYTLERNTHGEKSNPRVAICLHTKVSATSTRGSSTQGGYTEEERQRGRLAGSRVEVEHPYTVGHTEGTCSRILPQVLSRGNKKKKTTRVRFQYGGVVVFNLQKSIVKVRVTETVGPGNCQPKQSCQKLSNLHCLDV